MGMYDQLNVKGNKFGIPYNRYLYRYQTKDLVCGLNTFALDDSGCLIIEENFNREYGEDPNRVLHLNGNILLYRSLPNNITGIDFVEFIITFEKGKIVKVAPHYSIARYYSDTLQEAFDLSIPTKTLTDHYQGVD